MFAIASIASGDVINRSDFKPAPDNLPGEERAERTIEIGPNVKLDAVTDVTVRRNGTLRVANLQVKILDEYDDGQIYVGGLLHVEFVDISGDGLKDLVITGTIANTGEKETDPVSYSAVTEIYRFRPQEKDFQLTFRHGPALSNAVAAATESKPTPDLREAMLASAKQHDANFPDGQSRTLTSFAYIGTVSSAEGPLRVAWCRSVISNMPAPRGQAWLSVHSPDGAWAKSIPCDASAPALWCEGSKVFFYGLQQQDTGGNVLDLKDGVAKWEHEPRAGSWSN
jgi:hypothetical protein